MRFLDWLAFFLLLGGFACQAPSSHAPEPRESSHRHHSIKVLLKTLPALSAKRRIYALELLEKEKVFPARHRVLLKKWWKSKVVGQRLLVLKLHRYTSADQAVLELFLESLRDPVLSIRQEGMKALLVHFSPSASPPTKVQQQLLAHLLQLLDSPPRPGGAWGAAVTARRVFAKMPSSWSLYLMRRYPGLSKRAKSHLLFALGHHSHAQVPFFLARGLSESELRLRRFAANALLLQRYRALVVLKELRGKLKDRDPLVRGQLLQLLALLGPLARSAANDVRSAFQQSTLSSVKVQALLTLRRLKLHDDKLRETLLQGMKDYHPSVRLAAVQGLRLSMLKDRAFRKRWSALFQDSSLTVRTAVLQWSLQFPSSSHLTPLRQKARQLCKSKPGHYARGTCL